MNARYERRSREAPMDFEFTEKKRYDIISANSPFVTTIKRSHTDMASSAPLMPTFGANNNTPFLFNQSAPPTTPSQAWSPPSPRSHHTPELNDVAMQDASPSEPDASPQCSNPRTIATGALTRVFRSRQKQKERSQGRGGRRRRTDHDEDDYAGTDDDPSEVDEVTDLVKLPRRKRGLQKSYSDPVTTTANHNHHYTLHMPTPQLSHSEIPYILLGYLQFFFNLSLVLGLIYLMICFLRAVQKDVEQKMTEYKLESLQEIKTCAILYADNFCADKPSPIIMHQCHEWKACMERDASLVGRTKLLAELIGEVINGFMEPITWRTLIFSITSLTMGIAFINTLLMFYRARHAPSNNQAMPSSAPTPSFPMYGITSPPPSWGQPHTPIPFVFQQDNKGDGSRSIWSAPPDRDDTLETPSRRRKLTEDDAVKVR